MLKLTTVLRTLALPVAALIAVASSGPAQARPGAGHDRDAPLSLHALLDHDVVSFQARSV